MHARYRRRSGFSLIELLVVIAIIALLMAILIPVITHVRAAGRRTVCASNLSQIGKCIYLYANDNHGEIPAVYSDKPPKAVPIVWTRPVVETKGPGYGGMRLLVTAPMGYARQAYLRDAQLFTCPGQRATFPIPQATSDDFLHAPHNDSGMSYGYFYVPRVIPSDKSALAIDPQFAKFERHATNQHGSASIAILAELTANHLKGFTNPDWHGPGGNVLYLDGHVTWINSSSLPERASFGQTPSIAWMSEMDGADTN
jgi:prepilin-type N-terminal cleavage/methylation domain-containing protein/prepilin-type processing-associated H-X9-DG protein